MDIKVFKTDVRARLPKKATEGSLFDLASVENCTIRPGEVTRISTGLRFDFPPGVHLMLASRSSMALKHLTLPTGVIDCSYRGIVYVVISNNGQSPYSVLAGDRIAQAYVVKTPDINFTEVATDADFTKTARGSGGFGSTGR